MPVLTTRPAPVLRARTLPGHLTKSVSSRSTLSRRKSGRVAKPRRDDADRTVSLVMSQRRKFIVAVRSAQVPLMLTDDTATYVYPQMGHAADEKASLSEVAPVVALRVPPSSMSAKDVDALDGATTLPALFLILAICDWAAVAAPSTAYPMAPGVSLTVAAMALFPEACSDVLYLAKGHELFEPVSPTSALKAELNRESPPVKRSVVPELSNLVTTVMPMPGRFK